MSNESILDHHMTALLAGDIDAIMEDYADDAVLIIGGLGLLEGKEAIGAGFQGVPPEMFAGFEETDRHVAGEIAYITWKTDATPLGTDTFVIRDDRIVAQTVAMHTG